jgi:hypothetical protein
MLVYFMTIWNILWPFGIECGHLVYFSSFGMFDPRKIWQTWPLYLYVGTYNYTNLFTASFLGCKYSLTARQKVQDVQIRSLYIGL